MIARAMIWGGRVARRSRASRSLGVRSRNSIGFPASTGSRGRSRSTIVPSATAATTASASRLPIPSAISRGRTPSGYSLIDPSGSLIWTIVSSGEGPAFATTTASGRFPPTHDAGPGLTRSIARDGEGRREVHPIGFEPITFGSVDRCSIQLSYGCIARGIVRDSSGAGEDLFRKNTPAPRLGEIPIQPVLPSQVLRWENDGPGWELSGEIPAFSGRAAMGGFAIPGARPPKAGNMPPRFNSSGPSGTGRDPARDRLLGPVQESPAGRCAGRPRRRHRRACFRMARPPEPGRGRLGRSHQPTLGDSRVGRERPGRRGPQRARHCG